MSTNLTVLNKDIKEILISESEIEELVTRVANEINEYYSAHPVKNKLIMVGILKGSVVFMSDLMRHINLPLELEFIRVSSYGNGTVSSGNVEFKLGIDDDVLRGSDLLIVEDIFDSGRTLKKVIEYFKTRDIESLKLCTLLNKPEGHVVDLDVDFCGHIVGNEFVVGYGLDYAGTYRNLPYIGVLKPEIYEK